MPPKKTALKSPKTRAKKASANRSRGSSEEAPYVGRGLSFPVVAVGASAGGLTAFTELLKALPLKTGMAFVLIQHLEPKHESALTSLLSKATSMTVVEVSDGMTVKPNQVYVIPPNKQMSIRKRVLRLTPRSSASGMQRPIDDFLVALAEEQGDLSIGAVFSGTGGDGTNGLKAIKAAGGLTFAQDPKTAQWPAMPMSAIAAGAVDFVLSPKHIAAQLVRIGRHPYLAEAREVPEGGDLDKVCVILRSAVGVDFRLYKQATLLRRMARRMALQKITSLAKYARVLKQNPDEAQALADDIFIHVTGFFRHPESFQALRKQVLAKLGRRRPAEDPIRIWVPGCSTGEEVYSIVMLLLEELGDLANRIKIQIFGTDIQERAVEHARAGVYSAAAVAGVSPLRLKRFFVKTDHGYQVQKTVRDLCVFARHDLGKDPPFSRLDLISCRNVLIYMGQALQKRVLSMFQYALKPGGILFLGNSESIGGRSEAFYLEDQKHHIFVRKATAPAFREPHSITNYPREPVPAPVRISAPSMAIDFRKEAEGALLEKYAPPALIVDPDLHIVHFQGDVSAYLRPATGQPSFHLLKMVRPEFVVNLRTAIYRAVKDGKSGRDDRTVPIQETVRFEYEGRPATARLEVKPLHWRNGKKQYLLVVFQKLEPAISEEKQRPGRANAPGRAPERAERAERDLASAQEQLRTLIAEHESAQEEMKAAAEEIQSSNEELQSTNEELETAKEELQSANEELVTLNEELQHRNDELTVLTHDLTNLLVGVDIPVLVLDADLRVRRFTPLAGSLLNLIPGDVGRPFSDIASNLDVGDWDELCAKVTEQGRLIEREVQGKQGHRYSLRMRPYRTDGHKIQGVLVVMLDTELIFQARDEARKARDLALKAEQFGDSILSSLATQLSVLRADGTIVTTNRAWDSFARENGGHWMHEAGVGVNLLQACRRAADEGASGAKATLNGIQGVLKGRRDSFALEYASHSPSNQRWFSIHVTPLEGAAKGAVIAHSNITDRKLAELATRQSEATIRALLEAAQQSVIAVSRRGGIMLANENTERMFGYRRDELIGQKLEILIPELLRERHAERHEGYFADMQSRSMGVGLNPHARRRDGTLFPVEVSLGAIETQEGKFAVAFITDITERRQLEQAAETRTQEIQALAARLLTVQEEERRRVSRELHDQICQQLGSLAIDVSALAADPLRPERAQQQLREVQKRVVKASEETRHIAYALHPATLDDLGLVASLRELCNRFCEQNPDTLLEFESNAPRIEIPLEVASCLYRVAQEGLQNVARHSRAEHASVALSADNGAILLTVADDGVGFDLESVHGLRGLGLIGMEERAQLVHGKLTLATQPGHGTRIALEVSLAGGGS